MNKRNDIETAVPPETSRGAAKHDIRMKTVQKAKDKKWKGKKQVPYDRIVPFQEKNQ